MFKSFASLLRRKSTEEPEPAAAAADEHEPIYKELAMTDELREALFPTSPKMVSAIFDRSVGSLSGPTPPPPRPDAGPTFL